MKNANCSTNNREDEFRGDRVEQASFEERHPHLKEAFAFIDELNDESDRGAALVSAAMLDDLLKKIISSFIVENKETKKLLSDSLNSPLGSLSARALAAYSLGLINQREYEECDRIRRVRNEFAHNVRQKFMDDKVRDLCSKLTFSIPDMPPHPNLPKGQFTTAAVSLILRLTNRPHFVSLKRLQFGDWKI